VINRARRSFVITMGLLIFGFIAIAIAVVYRSGSTEAPGAAYEAGVIAVPAGAEVVSAVPAEGMIAVTYRTSEGMRLRLINGATGALIRDIPFAEE